MKKAIVVVSFGTSYPDTLKKCIENIEQKITDRYLDYRVVRAFTSRMIVKKISERDGIQIPNTQQALSMLIEEGYEEIIVQPLHVIPGFEYEKVKRAVAVASHNKSVAIRLGTPLLNHHQDYLDVIDALLKQLPSEKERHGVLLMGHGTHHHANACYVMLERLIRERRKDVWIANVEGYPELTDIMDEVKKNCDSVTVTPFMLVAGDHARNDMAGDDEDSFKSLLESTGIQVKCMLVGLGENEAVGDIFVNKIKALL